MQQYVYMHIYIYFFLNIYIYIYQHPPVGVSWLNYPTLPIRLPLGTAPHRRGVDTAFSSEAGRPRGLSTRAARGRGLQLE